MSHHLWAAHEEEAEKGEIPNPFTPENATDCPYCSRTLNVKSLKYHLSYAHSVKVHPKIKLLKIYVVEKPADDDDDDEDDNKVEDADYSDNDNDAGGI